jgi:hypothetical protein
MRLKDQIENFLMYSFVQDSFTASVNLLVAAYATRMEKAVRLNLASKVEYNSVMY